MRRSVRRVVPETVPRPLLASIALALVPAHAQVAQGPMVQALTSNQAGVWLRTATAQAVRLQLIGPGAVVTTTAPVSTDPASDDTAKFMLTGLAPGASYAYRIGTTDPATGIESWTGKYTFETVRAEVDSLKIAVLSDFALQLASSAALQRALDARPDLLAIIGDLDHRGPAKGPDGDPYPPEDGPDVLADMRSMHRDSRDPATLLGRNFWSGLVGNADSGTRQIPMVYAWDDHDFCANNSDKTCPFAAQAFQAYNEYYILAPDNAYTAGCATPTDFESLTFGKLVQLFFLDARASRNNARPHGPTAMLGQCQHNWLVDGIRKSTATWKIVVSPVPLNPTMKPWDAWGKFQNERSGLLDAIAGVPNVVFVTGDVHSGGAVDDGSHSGRPEVSTPHANMPIHWVNTYCRGASKLESRPGSWTIGGTIDPNIGVEPRNCLSKHFADSVPIDGLPAPVYPLDGKSNPGYTWIDATPSRLTVTVRDVDGHVKSGVTARGAAAPLQLSLHPE